MIRLGHPRPVPFLGCQLHGRAEIVVQQAEVVGVKVVHALDHRLLLQPVVAKYLPHMSTVLLLDVCVIVAAIGA